jgi:hypothetical protein
MRTDTSKKKNPGWQAGANSCFRDREAENRAIILLDRLRGVKRTGPGRWIACCPAHDDKRPSLAIRRLDDGRILLHCFSGCDVSSVLAAVGLGMADLFPKAIGHCKPERRPFPAADVLRAIAHEASIVVVAGSDLAAGKQPSETDRERLLIAVSRIEQALAAAGVSHA